MQKIKRKIGFCNILFLLICNVEEDVTNFCQFLKGTIYFSDFPNEKVLAAQSLYF